MIWKRDFTIDALNERRGNTLLEQLDIVFEEKGDDFLIASMPVDRRTHQPMGILHGGASVVLAETLGSCASQMTLDEGWNCVGIEVQANHIKRVSGGRVWGKTFPLHLGRSTQVWDIAIRNAVDELICVSRLTIGILSHSS